MRRPTSFARCSTSTRRRGVSLLESLVAVAILFISVISINQLLDTAGQQAERVRQRSLAAQLCQSKMAEVVAGVVPLSGGSGEVEELPGWEWTVEAEEHDVTGLWRVRVSARRQNEDTAAASLDQLVLDPSKRGSAFDTAAPSGTDSSGQSSSGMGGSSGMSGTTQPSTGGATAPATGGATNRPTTGGTTAPATGGTNRPTGGGTTAPATGGNNRPTTGGSSRPGGR